MPFRGSERRQWAGARARFELGSLASSRPLASPVWVVSVARLARLNGDASQRMTRLSPWQSPSHSHNPYRCQNQAFNRRGSPRQSAHTLAVGPKPRHRVTSLQGLDLRVTHFFGLRRFATHALECLRFKCDARLHHSWRTPASAVVFRGRICEQRSCRPAQCLADSLAERGEIRHASRASSRGSRGAQTHE